MILLKYGGNQEYTVPSTMKPGNEDNQFIPAVEFKECPIRVSLGVLGKKWTLLILRNIAFLRIDIQSDTTDYSWTNFQSAHHEVARA